MENGDQREASIARRAELLDRFERATELPLLLLALAMIPLLIVPLLVDLSPSVDTTLIALDWAIWVAFSLEYVVRLTLTTTGRWRFVRREWPDLLIIVLPFLRPLRIVRSARALRLLRLGRLAGFLAEAGQEARRLLVRHQLHYALLVTMLVILGCAGLVFALEENGGGAIDSFGDALWWAVTTITTVGYGDTYPVTPAGRAVAAFLMVSGIALFGVLTANLAAFLLERSGAKSNERDGKALSEDDRLDLILERLTTLEAAVAALDRGDERRAR